MRLAVTMDDDDVVALLDRACLLSEWKIREYT